MSIPLKDVCQLLFFFELTAHKKALSEKKSNVDQLLIAKR